MKSPSHWTKSFSLFNSFNVIQCGPFRPVRRVQNVKVFKFSNSSLCFAISLCCYPKRRFQNSKYESVGFLSQEHAQKITCIQNVQQDYIKLSNIKKILKTIFGELSPNLAIVYRKRFTSPTVLQRPQSLGPNVSNCKTRGLRFSDERPQVSGQL